jgi:PAS domain-containing protein
MLAKGGEDDMPLAQKDIAAMTSAGLNLIQQAMSIYDEDLKLVVCNRRFLEMFDIPEAHGRPGTNFKDTIRLLVERGEYGPVDDVDTAVAMRVEQARAFTPHYMERERANGRWISVEGSPLPQGGWVAVYTDITRTKRQEALLRTRSEALSDRVLNYAEDLAAANRELEATITALEEAKRQLAETEARTRQTTEMMPAHIAHVDRNRRYTFSNRKLSNVMPGRPAVLISKTRLVRKSIAPLRPIWTKPLPAKHPSLNSLSKVVHVGSAPPLLQHRISTIRLRMRAASTFCPWTSPAKRKRVLHYSRPDVAKWQRS